MTLKDRISAVFIFEKKGRKKFGKKYNEAKRNSK